MNTELSNSHSNPAPEVPIDRVVINDESPLDTADLRGHSVFLAADPENRVPNVTLGTAPLNPRDRAHVNEQRVSINHAGKPVGALNLKQLPGGTTWIRDVYIDAERRGEGLSIAAYLGVIAAAHEAGRRVQSDPAGLSPSPDGRSPARSVWESLVRRGIAVPVEEQQDQHGNPRFISEPPKAK